MSLGYMLRPKPGDVYQKKNHFILPGKLNVPHDCMYDPTQDDTSETN